MSRRRLVTAGLLLVVLAVGIAVGITRVAEGPDRIERLTQQLRCPGCGPSVAEGEGETPRQITELIRTQTEAGWSDERILDDFAARYGTWILRDPPPAERPWRWLLPGGAIAAGVGLAVVAPGRVLPSEGRLRNGAVVAGGALVVVGCLGAGWFLVDERGEEAPPTAVTATVGDLKVDPASISEEQLEQVVEDNPQVVAMRLALVERYLAEGKVKEAHSHTAVAVDIDSAPIDRQRALKLHGWTTALLGDAQAGADLLEAALLLAPEDRDALWYLANVRLTGLDQPDAAAGILERLLESPTTDEQRAVIEAKLEEARAST